MKPLLNKIILFDLYLDKNIKKENKINKLDKLKSK